ncbi:MAG: hypothetical protein KatS3mg110_4253 [Pirellulaceae bacterium]|nr:MAG: hypothetical protein KatS3mg110_4253 [Pirellulaceae bacterium]
MKRSLEALILVDLQNDFLPGGALPVPEGDQVVPLANRLQPHFPIVVASMDWHPANHKSFASQHPGRRVGETIQLAGMPQVLWPDHCVQDSSGAAFAPDLYTGSLDHIVHKGVDPDIDSYSAFFDNGRRRDTGLADYLRSRSVDGVYIMGLATDYCVKATALDAAALGFTTFVIEDACRGVELKPGDCRRALDEMERAGVRRVTTARWLDPVERQRHLDEETSVIHEGRFVRLVARRGWEFAARRGTRGVVAIVAVTPDRHVLFVEQYRWPVARRCLELPAGLVDDTAAAAGESFESAVKRELWEETGYEAGSVCPIAELVPSAGLTSETTWIYLATDLERTGSGGGTEDEAILVHHIPWDDATRWLAQRAADGYLVAASLYAGLWLAAEKLRWPIDIRPPDTGA